MRRFTFTQIALAAALTVLPGAAGGQVGSPAGPVPPELLARRRDALMAKIGSGVIVVRSASERSIEGEYPQDSDFRQTNDFFYLTGLESADSWLVLTARNGKGDAILYLPPRDPGEEQWTGPKLGPGPEAGKLTGIADVRGTDRLPLELAAMLGSADSPATQGLYLDEPFAAERCPQSAERAICVAKLVLPFMPPGNLPIKSLNAPLAALRLVKDGDEVRRLRRAIEITAEAHRDAMAAIVPGMWEYEIEAIVEYGFRRRGAERVAFPSIIGSGPNATTLHYDKSRRRTEAGDLIVIDIGAEFGYYAADVTRTVPSNGKFSPRQRALYDLVLASQQAALDAVKPGLTMGDLNRIARQYMRTHSGDQCAPDTCDKYFIHGLSHWLGMDVHDVGASNAPFVAGMVFTIEPGIYIPKENIGIRIEDDVLVTPSGYELLSAGAPRQPQEIETLMARAKPRT